MPVGTWGAIGENARRPNAGRALLACLGERGYEFQPVVPMNETRAGAR